LPLASHEGGARGGGRGLTISTHRATWLTKTESPWGGGFSGTASDFARQGQSGRTVPLATNADQIDLDKKGKVKRLQRRERGHEVG